MPQCSEVETLPVYDPGSAVPPPPPHGWYPLNALFLGSPAVLPAPPLWCGCFPPCGVVWCGVVWCGVVWCGVVLPAVWLFPPLWCGVVWCGVVWFSPRCGCFPPCGVVWCGVVWFSPRQQQQHQRHHHHHHRPHHRHQHHFLLVLTTQAHAARKRICDIDGCFFRNYFICLCHMSCITCMYVCVYVCMYVCRHVVSSYILMEVSK